MTDSSAVESTTVTQRLVLYEFAELEREGETPARAPELLDRCRERLGELDEVVGGRLTEADLIRACRSLSDRDLVSERGADDTSPVGKGRPSYELAVDRDVVEGVVRDDERFEGLPADADAA